LRLDFEEVPVNTKERVLDLLPCDDQRERDMKIGVAYEECDITIFQIVVWMVVYRRNSIMGAVWHD